jgi:hypothetical protein
LEISDVDRESIVGIPYKPFVTTPKANAENLDMETPFFIEMNAH